MLTMFGESRAGFVNVNSDEERCRLFFRQTPRLDCLAFDRRGWGKETK
jgi:hypothetical protein